MNIFAILLTFSMLPPTSTSEYVHPVNLDSSEVRSTKTINFVDSKEDQFVHVKNGPVTYEELRFYALYECRNNRSPSEEIIDLLIRVEKDFSPPPSMRGMLLAAACSESGYNPLAKGDHKFSRSKKKPMAIGILQQWKFYEKAYPGMNRKNPESASRTWMHHITKQLPKVKKQCKYRTPHRIWLAAWVTGIRSKKATGRCNERPKHFKLLRKWHRNILRDRKKEAYCTGEDVCGC